MILGGKTMNSFSVQSTSRTELIDITGLVQKHLDSKGIRDGVITIYVPHTTAAVTINEGTDPAVQADILKVLNHIIPWEFGYEHMEGNSPAHIKTTLVGPSVQIIVENGQLMLGTWQRIFFCEFDGPRTRKVWIKG